MKQENSFTATTACTAFSGSKQVAAGHLQEAVLAVKSLLEHEPEAQVLIFDDATSELIEVDLRGTIAEVVGRIPKEAAEGAAEEARRPGRPKLGVVAREITLLPRHWEWLAGQPGGASVAIRKLVELARVTNRGRDERRRAQDVAYRFLTAMAGNEAGFEEALRALFAGDADRFRQETETWPASVREHSRKLAAAAFANRELQTV